MIEQFKVGKWVVNFLDRERGIALEVDDAVLTRQQVRWNRRRDQHLYKLCGIYTLRISKEELQSDPARAQARIDAFVANPTAPDEFIETAEEREQKRYRREILKGVKAQVSGFELAMIGKTRAEVLAAFSELLSDTNLQSAVVERIRALVNYWPDDGYSAPGLQKFTANKRETEKE